MGVLQGSPLSPVIANWNLARFDRAWRQLHGERAPLFRYADDLIVLARDQAHAARLRRPLEQCLRRSNRLALAAGKTRVGALDDGIPLLGLLLRRHLDPFTGRQEVRITVDPDRFRDVLAEVDQWVDQLDPQVPIGRQIKKFNQRLRGWFESYQYAYDGPQAFEALDAHLFVFFRRRLKAMIGCSVAALQDQYHHRLPSGHDTWQADGEHLLALSALPRKRYRPKRPRAPWESPGELAPVSTPTPRQPDEAVSVAADVPLAAPAGPVIAGLLRQAVEAARGEGATSPAPQSSEPLEAVAAGNGRLMPAPPSSTDTEGPSHGNA